MPAPPARLRGLSGLRPAAAIAAVVSLLIAALLAAPAVAASGTATSDTSPINLSMKVNTAAARAAQAATVVSGDARFEVLTPEVVRLEYASTKSFLDLPTFNVLNRNFTVPHYTTSEQRGWLSLRTDDLVLQYRIGSGPFTPENTRIQLLHRSADGTTAATPAWSGECTFGQACQSGAAGLSGGAALAADQDNYDSTAGFIAGLGSGAGATWKVLGAPAGTADLTLRYANGQSDGPRTVTVKVNGEAKQVSLPKTAGWDTWGTVSVPASLTAGTNSVAVTCATGDSCNVNVDDVSLTAPGAKAVPAEPAHPLGGYIRSYDSTHGTYDAGVSCGSGQSQAACTAALPRKAPGLLNKAGWSLLDDSATDVWNSSGWIAPRPAGDTQDGYLFGYGEDYTGALGDLAKLTGPSPLLPENTFGNWFSHYQAYSAADLQAIHQQFADNGTSVDTMSVDTDWKSPTAWNGWEFNNSLFPDPKGFFAWAKANHIATTLNIHPSISTSDPQYSTAQSIAGGTLAPNNCGQNCRVWNWSDIAQAESYFGVSQPQQDAGADFSWLDWCCDNSYVGRAATSGAGGVTPDSWINHLYAQQLTNAGRRGFALSRIGASYQQQIAGSYNSGPWADHRSALAFTGDTHGTWNTLASQAQLAQDEGSIGQPYVSDDIGSFLGAPGGGKNDPADLYLRWLQLGTFQPIMRLHSDVSQNTRVPWSYDPTTRAAGDQFLKLREQLVPYLYTLAHDSTAGGLPMTKALYLDYPKQDEAYNHPGEYLLGDNMLVAPVTTPGQVASTTVWFPPGQWTDYFTGATFTGPASHTLNVPTTRMPVFVKAGGVVPLQPADGHAETAGSAPLTVRAYAGGNGSYSLYGDAGQGLGYQQGQYTQTPVTDRTDGDRTTVTIGAAHGSYPGAPASRQYTVEIASVSKPSQVLVGNTPVPASGWSYDAASHTVSVPLGARPTGSPVDVTAVGGAALTNVGEPTVVGLTLTAPNASLTAGTPTTVTANVQNYGPGSISAAKLALTTPSGWTVAPSGTQSLGTLAANASVTQKWTVTPPNSSQLSTPADLRAQLDYTDSTGSAASTADDLPETVYSFGTHIGGVTDPAGDDKGPGSYVYPTNNAFNPGSLDLTNFDVYRNGDNINMVTRVDGAIQNPWGGTGMSTQRLNIYVHDPSNTSTTPTPLLPGTNMDAAGPWSQAVVADGRHQTSTYGEGVYGSDRTKIGPADLTVRTDANQIIVTMPAGAFGTTDLAKATYQVSMFGDADDTEGIGNIRPVYSTTCWNGGDGCPSFVNQYRFGGGAGDWDGSVPSQDTDTKDPNAIDIISGTAAQSSVLDWTKGSPVVTPYVPLSK